MNHSPIRMAMNMRMPEQRRHRHVPKAYRSTGLPSARRPLLVRLCSGRGARVVIVTTLEWGTAPTLALAVDLAFLFNYAFTGLRSAPFSSWR